MLGTVAYTPVAIQINATMAEIRAVCVRDVFSKTRMSRMLDTAALAALLIDGHGSDEKEVPTKSPLLGFIIGRSPGAFSLKILRA